MSRGFRTYTFIIDTAHFARWWCAVSRGSLQSPVFWKPVVGGATLGALLGVQNGALAYRDRTNKWVTAGECVCQRVFPLAFVGAACGAAWPLAVPLIIVIKAGAMYAKAIDRN